MSKRRPFIRDGKLVGDAFDKGKHKTVMLNQDALAFLKSDAPVTGIHLRRLMQLRKACRVEPYDGEQTTALLTKSATGLHDPVLQLAADLSNDLCALIASVQVKANQLRYASRYAMPEAEPYQPYRFHKRKAKRRTARLWP